MTLEQTRQLGIEFERRVSTILPDKEYSNKLDTQTIYSFLNQYQSQYIHTMYRGLDQIEPSTKLSAHVERVLQSMLKTQVLDKIDDSSDFSITYDDTWVSDSGRSITYTVPEDYYMYVRSVSNVTSTFSWVGSNNSVQVLPNTLTSQNDVWKLMETPHNTLRILRYPAAVMSSYLPPKEITKERTIHKEKTYYDPVDMKKVTFPGKVIRGLQNCYSIKASTLLDIDDNILYKSYNESEGVQFTDSVKVFIPSLSSNENYNKPLYWVQCSSLTISAIAEAYSNSTESIPNYQEKYNEYTDIERYLRYNQDVDILIASENLNPLYIKKTQHYTTVSYIKHIEERPTLTVIHDRYTTIKNVKLLYYKEPQYFDTISETPCELPMDCFDDLVSGAVQLYISYVRGGIRQQEEEGRRERAQQRQNEKEAERERKNEQ